uniref:Uncharacterized protein n=1 Tax=Romanomermis culicivorax TaxID=13658 RepID=A0A915IKW2_ROMCU
MIVKTYECLSDLHPPNKCDSAQESQDFSLGPNKKFPPGPQKPFADKISLQQLLSVRRMQNVIENFGNVFASSIQDFITSTWVLKSLNKGISIVAAQA